MASKLKNKAKKLPKLKSDRVRVYVSEGDIVNAIYEKDTKGMHFSSYKCCPISQALKRRFSNISGTGIDVVLLNGRGPDYSICNKGQEFIQGFDSGHLVHPFHLYLTKQKR